jgi:hypothetical protein
MPSDQASASPSSLGGDADETFFAPLDPLPDVTERLTARRLAQITWAFIAVGIAVRAVRYLLCFPLWPDEAYLAHNYLDRGYWDLLKPLDFIQIAPLLYLWAQKSIVRLFGFSEYSLRLYAFVCGVGGLFLFRHLAGRILKGTALLLAVSIFAVAYPLVRYSAEAKPYGGDMFVSLLLLTLAVEWLRNPAPARRGWLWGLVAALPVAILLSYAAIFVAAGISLAMAASILRRRAWRDGIGWVAANVAIAAGVAVLFAASAGNQMAASGAAQRAAFVQAFPPLDSFKRFAAYMLESHSGDALAYPLGGKHGASALTTLCCLAGLIVLLGKRRYVLALLCTAPLVFQFVAASVHGYPYGSHARFFLYLGPVICLLMGLGAAQLFAWTRLRRVPVAAPVTVLLVVLLAVAAGTAVRDFLRPYKESCWMRNRDFARWFWVDKAQDAELVCLYRDLLPGRHFYSPAEGDDLASVYFCNQEIYFPRRSTGRPADLAKVSRTHPLRCVRFRPGNTSQRDEAAFRQWLTGEQAKLELVGKESYPITFWVGRELRQCDDVEVYELVPRDAPAAAMAAAGGQLK